MKLYNYKGLEVPVKVLAANKGVHYTTVYKYLRHMSAEQFMEADIQVRPSKARKARNATVAVTPEPVSPVTLPPSVPENWAAVVERLARLEAQLATGGAMAPAAPALPPVFSKSRADAELRHAPFRRTEAQLKAMIDDVDGFPEFSFAAARDTWGMSTAEASGILYWAKRAGLVTQTGKGGPYVKV